MSRNNNIVMFALGAFISFILPVFIIASVPPAEITQAHSVMCVVSALFFVIFLKLMVLEYEND